MRKLWRPIRFCSTWTFYRYCLTVFKGLSTLFFRHALFHIISASFDILISKYCRSLPFIPNQFIRLTIKEWFPTPNIFQPLLPSVWGQDIEGKSGEWDTVWDVLLRYISAWAIIGILEHPPFPLWEEGEGSGVWKFKNKVPLFYSTKMTGREYTYIYIDIPDVYLVAVFCLSILSLPTFNSFNVKLLFI